MRPKFGGVNVCCFQSSNYNTKTRMRVWSTIHFLQVHYWVGYNIDMLYPHQRYWHCLMRLPTAKVAICKILHTGFSNENCHQGAEPSLHLYQLQCNGACPIRCLCKLLKNEQLFTPFLTLSFIQFIWVFEATNSIAIFSILLFFLRQNKLSC